MGLHGLVQGYLYFTLLFTWRYYDMKWDNPAQGCISEFVRRPFFTSNNSGSTQKIAGKTGGGRRREKEAVV
jgi:hypothetical protein